MQVEASWDAQSVADELGLPLGVSIRPEILPCIKALKAEVARLQGELHQQTLDANQQCYEANRRIGQLRDSLFEAKADVARLSEALETIASYGKEGICPYGCDTPHIATETLATVREKEEGK
jgi:predicted RNase H-like nuclease (RuvC/YqgF family)